MRLAHFRRNSSVIDLIFATAAVAALSAAKVASRDRIFSKASIGVLGFRTRSFLRLSLGETGCVFSRVNTNRRSMSPHSEHSSVWCSKPGTGIVSSCTTCVTHISSAHTRHRIATAPFSTAPSSPYWCAQDQAPCLISRVASDKWQSFRFVRSGPTATNGAITLVDTGRECGRNVDAEHLCGLWLMTSGPRIDEYTP